MFLYHYSKSFKFGLIYPNRFLLFSLPANNSIVHSGSTCFCVEGFGGSFVGKLSTGIMFFFSRMLKEVAIFDTSNILLVTRGKVKHDFVL